MSLGRRRFCWVELNRLCNVKSQSPSNEWPRSVNDCLLRSEDARERPYEAARGGGGF